MHRWEIPLHEPSICLFRQTPPTMCRKSSKAFLSVNGIDMHEDSIAEDFANTSRAIPAVDDIQKPLTERLQIRSAHQHQYMSPCFAGVIAQFASDSWWNFLSSAMPCRRIGLSRRCCRPCASRQCSPAQRSPRWPHRSPRPLADLAALRFFAHMMLLAPRTSWPSPQSHMTLVPEATAPPRLSKVAKYVAGKDAPPPLCTTALAARATPLKPNGRPNAQGRHDVGRNKDHPVETLGPNPWACNCRGSPWASMDPEPEELWTMSVCMSEQAGAIVSCGFGRGWSKPSSLWKTPCW